MISLGCKVVVKEGCWHMMTKTNLGGRIGTVVGINAMQLSIKFPKGILNGIKGEPTLLLSHKSVVVESRWKAYQSAMQKLTDEEKAALEVY